MPHSASPPPSRLQIFKKWLARIALAVLGLLALLVIGTVVLNLQDDALDEAAAQAMQPPVLAEADLKGNAYLIILGIDAPDDQPPESVGLARLQASNPSVARSAQPVAPPPPRPLAASTLRCNEAVQNCLRFYQENRAEIEKALAQHSVLLQRYEAARRAPQLVEIAPGHLDGPWPTYSHLVRAHELTNMQAALRILDGYAAEGLQQIMDNVRFAQRMAQQSRSLLSPMIARNLQTQHLRLLGELVAAQPALAQLQPGDWQALLVGGPPPSLAQAVQGEQKLIMNLLFAPLTTRPRFSSSPWPVDGNTADENPSWLQTVYNHIQSLFFLPRNTANLANRHYQNMIALAQMPPADIATAYPQFMRQAQDAKGWGWPPFYFRNPLGKILLDIYLVPYNEYMERLADGDGHQKLIALQLRLTQEGIARENVAQWLTQHGQAYANPYTGSPMQWNPRTGELQFSGRQPNRLNHQGTADYRVVVHP